MVKLDAIISVFFAFKQAASIDKKLNTISVHAFYEIRATLSIIVVIVNLTQEKSGWIE